MPALYLRPPCSGGPEVIPPKAGRRGCETPLSTKWTQPIPFLLKNEKCPGGRFWCLLAEHSTHPNFGRRGRSKPHYQTSMGHSHFYLINIMLKRMSCGSSVPYSLFALGDQPGWRPAPHTHTHYSSLILCSRTSSARDAFRSSLHWTVSLWVATEGPQYQNALGQAYAFQNIQGTITF